MGPFRPQKNSIESLEVSFGNQAQISWPQLAILEQFPLKAECQGFACRASLRGGSELQRPKGPIFRVHLQFVVAFFSDVATNELFN